MGILEREVLSLIVVGGLYYLLRDRENPTTGVLWGAVCLSLVVVVLLYAG
jgi:hypothetical protein